MATDAEPRVWPAGPDGHENTAQSDPRLHRCQFPGTLFSEAAHWLSSPARSSNKSRTTLEHVKDRRSQAVAQAEGLTSVPDPPD